MAEFFPQGPPGSWEGFEPTEHLDPLLDRRRDRHPWQVRSAQFRAWALAEAVFGKSVRVSLSGTGSYQAFRGLLTLSVPFHDLDDHRAREGVFLAWARQDPVLSGMPLVYVFEPTLVAAQ